MECLLHSQSTGSDPKPHRTSSEIPEEVRWGTPVSKYSRGRTFSVIQDQSQIDEAMSQIINIKKTLTI